jgi:hypothetical protein
MKEFAALILLIVLICIGWNQPYKAHFSSVIGDPPAVSAAPVAQGAMPAPASPAVAIPQATPARDTSWLWNKTSMDAPYTPAESKGGKHGR